MSATDLNVDQNVSAKKRKVNVETVGAAFTAITNGAAVNADELNADEMELLSSMSSYLDEVL